MEVLDLYDLSASLFETLRTEFAVPARYPLPLQDVDRRPGEAAVVDVAAFAMCNLQVVRRYSCPDEGWDSYHLVGVLIGLVGALDELIEHVTDHPGLLHVARERFYDAAWAVARDTGGPGLFDPP